MFADWMDDILGDLRSENKRLREALRDVVEGYDKSMLHVADENNPFTASIRKAREALADA